MEGQRLAPRLTPPLPARVVGKVVVIFVPIHPTLASVEIQPHHLCAHGRLG